MFILKGECQSNLTQAAFCRLKSGEKVEPHTHPTMEEFYYFKSGMLNLYIGDEQMLCKKGNFVMVPAGAEHFLEAQKDSSFIYWGIST